MPAERSSGMDHSHYSYSPLPTRAPLVWPENKPLALGALVLLEHYEWEPPTDAYSLRNASGGLIKLPAPDYVQLTHREYGHRVGVFRLLDTLEHHGIPATVAVDKVTAIHYPWLVDHLMQRGCELVGHGVAASQIITSKLSKEAEVEIIGDSLDNDIRGANLQKLDSLLITAGIHREVNNHNGVDKEKLNDLIRKKKIIPNFFMKDLVF